MSRPLKEGLDYFPLNCDMDDKVEALEAELGIEGFGVFIRLLQSIYKTNNGELNLNVEGFSMWKTLQKRIGKPEEYIRKSVELMVNIGLFDKEGYQKRKVLTSSGIKKRVDHISALRRKDRERSSYPDGKPVENQWKRGESKEKESKVNKRKEHIYNNIPPALEEVEAYCRERANNINAEQFINYYAARGWMLNKTKMRDWRAAIRTWEMKDKSRDKNPYENVK